MVIVPERDVCKRMTSLRVEPSGGNPDMAVLTRVMCDGIPSCYYGSCML